MWWEESKNLGQALYDYTLFKKLSKFYHCLRCTEGLFSVLVLPKFEVTTHQPSMISVGSDVLPLKLCGKWVSHTQSATTNTQTWMLSHTHTVWFTDPPNPTLKWDSVLRYTFEQPVLGLGSMVLCRHPPKWMLWPEHIVSSLCLSASLKVGAWSYTHTDTALNPVCSGLNPFHLFC